MSTIQLVTSEWECDTPGCPANIRITRWRREGEEEDAGMSDSELIDIAKKIGWAVKGHLTFCWDCVEFHKSQSLIPKLPRRRKDKSSPIPNSAVST